MNVTLLIVFLLAISLIFTALSLLGLYDPRLGLARDRSSSLRRNSAIALIGYALMAIVLSANDIEHRGYDQGLHAQNPPHARSLRQPD